MSLALLTIVPRNRRTWWLLVRVVCSSLICCVLNVSRFFIFYLYVPGNAFLSFFFLFLLFLCFAFAVAALCYMYTVTRTCCLVSLLGQYFDQTYRSTPLSLYTRTVFFRCYLILRGTIVNTGMVYIKTYICNNFY